MNGTPRAVRMAQALLHPLLRLHPRDFRERNAAEMRAVLQDALTEAQREQGAGGLLKRAAREALDLAATAARLHWTGADYRARARGRKTPHPSTPRGPMKDETRGQRLPRTAGIACAVAATGAGMLYMTMAGAPATYIAMNGLALVMGLGMIGLARTAGRDRHLPGGIVLVLGAALLATALFGLRVDGAARWVRLGGTSVQVSLIVLPAMLVSFARHRDRHSTLGIAVAALALAVQPDRAMAGILASAVAVLAVTTRDPRAHLALAGAAAGFAATLLRPDTLPAVPYVDQVLYTSFDAGLVAGLAVTGGALLLIVPALLGFRYDPDHREVHAVFGTVWLGAVAAAALGNYPTPLVGYGGSAILGYALSLSLIPPKRHPAAAGARAGDGASAKAGSMPAGAAELATALIGRRGPRARAWTALADVTGEAGGAMARRSSRAGAVALAFLLIAGAAQQGDAQPGWQPAAGHTQIPLWPNGPPDPRPGVGAEAVHYAVDPETRQRKLVGGRPYQYVENVTRPTITVYPPTTGNTGAAVIVYPGGGFNVLAIDIEGTEACDWLTSNGITCVLLKYRVPCQHEGDYRECPSAHQDAQRAMSIVRSRAGEWHIDPNRIGVMGFSAGAHMAIMSSTRFDRLYAAVDEADRVSSRPDFAIVLYPGRVAYRRTNFVPNPDIRVTERTPPTFLVHTWDDPMNLVENSLIYATALRRAGVPAELHVYAQGGHAFGLRRTELSATAWPELAEAWLKAIGVVGP